jgi:hypothetical protein
MDSKKEHAQAAKQARCDGRATREFDERVAVQRKKTSKTPVSLFLFLFVFLFLFLFLFPFLSSFGRNLYNKNHYPPGAEGWRGRE